MNIWSLPVGVCLASLAMLSAQGASVTYTIDQPWEFYTAGTIGQDLTNLKGTITFDRDINAFAPTSWRFELTHFASAWSTENGFGSSTVYPLVIEGSGFSYFDAEGFSWTFQNDVTTGIRFGWAAASQNAVLDGDGDTVNFLAYEYVQRGPISSQRIINAGQVSTVPEPGSAALCLLGGMIALRRRR